MSGPLRLVIFDVDGTLVDSQADILAAMRAAFAEVGEHAPDRARILGIVGLSLDVAEGVTIQVRDISIEFDTFDWEYKKSSFPSTSDAGRAATTVIDLCITVSFRIGASSSTMFAMQR